MGEHALTIVALEGIPRVRPGDDLAALLIAALERGGRTPRRQDVLVVAQKVDQLVVGGGIANTFLLAEGFPIGKSLAEPDLVAECRKVLATLAAKGATLPLPIDVVVAREFSATAPATVRRADSVQPDEMILDIGPSSALALGHIVRSAGTMVDCRGPARLGAEECALSIYCIFFHFDSLWSQIS